MLLLHLLMQKPIKQFRFCSLLSLSDRNCKGIAAIVSNEKHFSPYYPNFFQLDTKKEKCSSFDTMIVTTLEKI
jgi:hypothetical protein